MNEIQFEGYMVTCQTQACGNGGATIPVMAPVIAPTIICGVCNVEIVDVVVASEWSVPAEESASPEEQVSPEETA